MIAGFFLASSGNFDWSVFVAVTIGSICIVGSGCVINNYIDRNIDKKMNRTTKRALVTGQISVVNALIFASVLVLIGLTSLMVGTNWLTVIVGLVGWIAYVIVYGIAKRKSEHGTLIGTISGAIPPVAGYTAVSNSLDEASFLLFLILVFWQMPHFYAIALFRLKDYKAANIPVLPAVKGVETTKKQMLVYLLLFTFTASALTPLHLASRVYLVVMLTTSAYWLLTWFKGATNKDYEKWAKRHFSASLYVLMIWSIMIVVDSFFI